MAASGDTSERVASPKLGSVDFEETCDDCTELQALRGSCAASSG